MLDLDQQHAREARRDPVEVRLPGVLLLDPVVALEPEALAVVRLEAGIGRQLAEAGRVRRKMAVRNHERIARLGMLVESPRQPHPGTEMDLATPEPRQALAADAHVTDVLGLLLLERLDRRNLLVKHERDAALAARLDAHRHRRRIEIAGLAVPDLSLALVRRQAEPAAIAANEGLVAVQHRLDPVLPGRQQLQRMQREAVGTGVDHARLACLPVLHVHPEERHRVLVPVHLEARFLLAAGSEDEEQPSRQRAFGDALWIRDAESRRGENRRGGKESRQGGQDAAENAGHRGSLWVSAREADASASPAGRSRGDASRQRLAELAGVDVTAGDDAGDLPGTRTARERIGKRAGPRALGDDPVARRQNGDRGCDLREAGDQRTVEQTLRALEHARKDRPAADAVHE